MSESQNGPGPGPGLETIQVPPAQARLVISLLPSGQVNLATTGSNPLMSYGLLELAKDIVRKSMELQESRIVRP